MKVHIRNIFLLLILWSVHMIYAQESPDGDGTLSDLIHQITERIQAIENREVVYLTLQNPVSSGNQTLLLTGTSSIGDYYITGNEHDEICVTVYTNDRSVRLDDDCFSLRDITSVLHFDVLDIDELDDVPRSRDSDDISGLFFGTQQIKRQAGYFMQLINPIYDEQLGLIFGPDYIGTSYITSTYISSLWKEYMCITKLGGEGGGYGTLSNICIPYHNIAYLRPINDSDTFLPSQPRFHIDSFTTIQSNNSDVVNLDFDTTINLFNKWLEIDSQYLLDIELLVPIQLYTGSEILSNIQVAKETSIEEDKLFMFSRLGDDYFCIYQNLFLPRLRSDEICITFYNVLDIVQH